MESIPTASGIPVHCAHHEIVSIHDLKPHPANPNKHPEKQLALYAEAIRQHGWREAIRVSKLSGFLVNGHGAVDAARRLGVDKVPVEYHHYASEQEELADMLAHNRIAELSVRDGDKLKQVLLSLGGPSCPLVTGYTPSVVAEMLAEAAPLPAYPITPRLNEAHRVFCVVVDNETDWAFLKSLVGIRLERSYKNQEVGEAHAMRFAQFLTNIRENLHSFAPSRRDDDHSSAA